MTPNGFLSNLTVAQVAPVDVTDARNTGGHDKVPISRRAAAVTRQVVPAVLDDSSTLLNFGLLYFRAGYATETIADPQQAIRHYADGPPS